MAISSNARTALRERVEYLRRHGAGIVLDADTHITDPGTLPEAMARRIAESPDYFHGRPLSAEQLLQYLDHAGVDGALVWQNPACTEYTDSESTNYERLLAANRYIHEAAARYPTRLFPAGWTDPRALGISGACDLVDQLVEELGFPIVKMNPAQNRFPIDSDKVFTVLERIQARGAAVAFHFGADTEFTPAVGLERLALAFPDTIVIAVHMGGGGAAYLDAEDLYNESRALGLRAPNIHYIFSAKRDTHIESDLITYQLAGPEAARRLMCASDAPYGLPTWNFGGFRTLFASLQDGANHPDPRLQAQPDLFDETGIAGYLGGNLARVIVDAGDCVLEHE